MKMRRVAREVDMVCALSVVDGITKITTLCSVMERVQRVRDFAGVGGSWDKTELSLETAGWWVNGEHRRFFQAYEREAGLLGYAMDFLVEGFREVGWGGGMKAYRRIGVEVIERWFGIRKGEGGSWIEARGGKVEAGCWVRE